MKSQKTHRKGCCDMKRFASALMAVIMMGASFVSCTSTTEKSATASADKNSVYLDYLRGNLETLPDDITIGDGDMAVAYGIDMSDVADDGFVTRAADGELLIFGKSDEGIDRAVRDFVKYGNADNYSKTYGEGYRVKKLCIAGNDISEYTIVYDSDDYNGNIELAADELAVYIERTCGAVIGKITDTEYDSLEVKPGRTITITVDYPALNNEAFRIEVDDDGNLTIYGGRVTGCIYGVYDFLEENVGWRFVNDVLNNVNPDDKGLIEYLYEAELVDITAEINRTEEPLFDSRRMDDLDNKAYGNYVYKEKIAENWYSGHGLNQVDYTGTPFEGRPSDQPCLCDEEILERIDEHTISYVEKRLEEAGVPQNYRLILDSHSHMKQYADANSVNCIVFNFGYLPGGDHNLATKASDSIIAIEQGLHLLKKGGFLSLCIYSGGDSGFEERDAILSYLKELNHKKYLVILSSYYNRPKNPPIPVLVWKL